MESGLKNFDPKLDLVFERKTTLSAEQLWKGWTDPTTLKKWFCPRPWKVTDCRIELAPGGEFYTLMEGPQGEKMPNHGAYLEVVPGKKLVWTNMMTKGFRPAQLDAMGFPFTATILFSPSNGGTEYKAIIRHRTEEDKKKHESFGFQEGWGMALKQLEDLK